MNRKTRERTVRFLIIYVIPAVLVLMIALMVLVVLVLLVLAVIIARVIIATRKENSSSGNSRWQLCESSDTNPNSKSQA